MGNFFHKAYQLISQKKGLSFFALLLIASLLAGIISRIAFEDDISSLIPESEESKRTQEILKSIAFTDKVIVNIHRDDDTSVEELTQYATDFLDTLQNEGAPYIKRIQGKLHEEDLPNTLNLVYKNLPLYLEEADYEALAQQLSADSIAQLTQQHYRTLISPSGIIASKTIRKDPLGLSFIALKKLQQLGIAEDFHLKDGFVIDQEEKNILLFITPVFASGETDKNTPFVSQLYDLKAQLQKTYGDQVSVDYFGAALVAVANAKQIKKDVQITASIALIVLFILLILFYRKLSLPLILFLPTVFGGLLSVAILVLLREKISAISLGIGSVLLGVTLDYSLHILTHIRNGKSLKSLFHEVTPSILMSSLTTASAFLCLLFLKSQALQDLGIFAAISVLGASVFALLFIPQVYRLHPKHASKRTLLDRLAEYKLHQNKWVIAGLAILLITSMFTYKNITFNKDIAKLNYESEVLIQARERLEALTDIESKSVYLATYGSEQENVLRQNDALYEKLKSLKSTGEIISYTSIGGLLPSQERQTEKIALWNDFWSTDKIETVKKNFVESGTTLGFKENTFAPFYALLNSEFNPIHQTDVSELASFAIEDFLVSDTSNTTITSLIKVDDAKLERVRASFENVSQTLLIDRKQVNETFLGSLKNDFNRLIWYSLIAVVLLLTLFYRSTSLLLITAIPLFLSWFLTIGVLAFFKIEFNIFNSIVSSFIFGLGVDYSIFITNGLLAEYRTGEKTLATHKTSIILSVLTTLLGIGVLVFAKHPALYSVSIVCIIGILSAALVSFTIQPLLFHLFIGNTNKRPIRPRVLAHSLVSFGYFDLGGILLSAYAWIIMKINPKAHLKKQMGLHQVVSKFMKSVLYTNPFLSKKVVNEHGETFKKPAMFIANHTSFLDILAMGMLTPKLIYLVKDHVYNSPTVGSAAKLHGAYPVSGGVENGEEFLQHKVAQGFSIVAFPEGARSSTNKVHRFHKGAFYLAERLGLDIVPVMIHGGAEVSPKGSFVIRDGSFTVEILPRIKAGDTTFGGSYRERPKLFGRYFRDAFRKMRNRLEGKTYWHQLILQNYRHKGNLFYKGVKQDLKVNGDTYKTLLTYLGEKETIIHISADWGQFDLLMALDSIDRRIHCFLADREAQAILKNNYLTHQYSKIKVFDNIPEVMAQKANVLIIDTTAFDLGDLLNGELDEITILILLKRAKESSLEAAVNLGFVPQEMHDSFALLKRI